MKLRIIRNPWGVFLVAAILSVTIACPKKATTMQENTKPQESSAAPTIMQTVEPQLEIQKEDSVPESTSDQGTVEKELDPVPTEEINFPPLLDGEKFAYEIKYIQEQSLSVLEVFIEKTDGEKILLQSFPKFQCSKPRQSIDKTRILFSTDDQNNQGKSLLWYLDGKKGKGIIIGSLSCAYAISPQADMLFYISGDSVIRSRKALSDIIVLDLNTLGVIKKVSLAEYYPELPLYGGFIAAYNPTDISIDFLYYVEQELIKELSISYPDLKVTVVK